MVPCSTAGLGRGKWPQIPGSPTVLLFSFKPDSAFPCGNPIPAYGMEGHGLPGEALITVSTSTLIPGDRLY